MQGTLALALASVMAAATAEAGVGVAVRVRAGLVPRPAGVYTGPMLVRGPVLRVTVGGAVVVKKGHGRLHVEVEPERAKVYIDGRYVGRGDQTRILRAGRHRVRVELADGREAGETVRIDAGQLTRVRLELN